MNFAAGEYQGMRYSSLTTRHEGHVGTRNPILGIGHTATDEPGHDIEGHLGRGTRGAKHLAHVQEWAQHHARVKAAQASQTADEEQRRPRNPATPTANHSTRSSSSPRSAAGDQRRRSSNVNLQASTDATAFKLAAGGGHLGRGKKIHTAVRVDDEQRAQARRTIARNVNINLRKPQQGVLKVQYRSPAAKYFGGSTQDAHHPDLHSAGRLAQAERPTDRGLLRASQEYGRNPILGTGHISRDEADRDLDGRHGAGSRGATGNRTANHQNAPHMGRQYRNVITGEGLRAYLSKNHSSVRVEDGDCASYAYYKDRIVPGKELGGEYRSTSQLQWTARTYTPHAQPKVWNWSQ